MNYNERLSGNEAIAFAMKQIDPDVMAAFPITPSTEIPQYFARGIRAQLDVRLHRRRGRRGAGHYGHVLCGPGPDV